MFKLKKIFLVIYLFLLIAPLYPVKAAELLPKESFLLKSNNSVETEKELGALGIESFKKIDTLGFYEIETNQDKINILANNKSTVSIEKNKKVKISQTPNDPYYPAQTYLTNSNIPSAWSVSEGSPSVIVAVIDTGVDYNHEDLKNKMWTNPSGYFGYDFVNGDNYPMDDNGHGTQISGIIAAQSNNGVGIAGIANVKIMAVKAIPYGGEGDVADLARGIIYAADNGARVANVSLGLAEESQALDDAITYARAKKCLIVAANGNLYRSFIDNPARNPNAVGVGAVDDSDVRTAYSNYGDGTSLVALGNKIYSSVWKAANDINGYEYGSGTSFAAPQVTGTAALIISKDPSLTSDQVKKRLISSAKKVSAMGNVGYSIEYGYGKLDAYTALTFDKYPPEASLALYKNTDGSYSIKGLVVDDKKSSDIYPDTPDSNIGLIRYQVDGSGNWITLNSNSTQLSNLNVAVSHLAPGEHNILIEASDTAGNKTNVNLSTKTALSSPASSNLSDYKYSFVSQSSYINTTPGQTTGVTLVLQNTGNSVWNKNMVHLGTSHPNDRSSVFSDQTWASSNRVVMQEDSVAVGEIAHFNFSVTSPNGISGVFNEYFNLVAEGIGWMSDMGIYWKVSVGSGVYGAQFINQSPYLIINKGSSASMWVDYQNSGSIAWNSAVVKLGTSNPLDRSSAFYDNTTGSGWKSANRIGMSKNIVSPGETVRFNFTVRAPNTPGMYVESFRPVADGVAWMEDAGLFWNIIVQ
jgi:thermitase